MKRNQIILVLILSFCSLLPSNAQNKYFLKVYYNEALPPKKFDISLDRISGDSLRIIKVIENNIHKLRGEGYLASSIDSVLINEDTIKSYLTVGKKYKWIKLEKGNIDQKLLSRVGFRERMYSGKDFSTKEFKTFQDDIISNAENSGYPFASISLDSISIEDQQISAILDYRPGPFIRFDTLSIVGSGRLKPRFITGYFKIGKGDVFNRSKIRDTENFLREFPSIKVSQQSNIIFSNYKAYPTLFLNHNPANVIDGIIGFLPNEQKQGKLLITGQLNLDLYNIGSSGRDLLIEWNKLKPLSQLLNAQFNNYNLFKSGLDVQAKFNLLKEDTTFINLNARLSISKYITNNRGRINFFTEYKNSRVGSANIIKEDPVNPEVADFNIVSYGLGYQWQKLDDLLNTRNGIKFQIDGLIGNKNVRNNTSEDSIPTTSIEKKTIQSSFSSSILVHKKISRKSGFYTKVSGGLLFNDQLFISDLFRLGGLKSLRGFNENYFFAKSYTVINMEYRYFYEPESYFVIFYDQGYIVSQYAKNNLTDLPLGIGGGLNLKTDVGILQIFYSVGKSRDQPLNFNYSKVHFGIVNRF